MGDVDLDRLAGGYAHRPASTAALARARRAAQRVSDQGGWLAVDVGGGPGEHAAEFAAAGARAIVVDRSPEMVQIARSRVAAVVGDGGDLPLGDRCADLVYFHASLHYGGWHRMIDEAVRVVRPGGRIVVWTFPPEHARSSFLAAWFPSVGRIDSRRFPDPGAIAGRLGSLGCRPVAVERELETVQRSAGSWEAAVRGGFVSTLQLLDAGELEEGLARFRRAHPDPDQVLDYRLDYRCVSGEMPGVT